MTHPMRYSIIVSTVAKAKQLFVKIKWHCSDSNCFSLWEVGY